MGAQAEAGTTGSALASQTRIRASTGLTGNLAGPIINTQRFEL